MKPMWLLMSAAVCRLAGCDKGQSEYAAPQRHGRYVGIGVYAVGNLWSKMADEGAPSDKTKAALADDEHVIVVVDSDTGEVRECGDYSGRCVGMNPWTKADRRRAGGAGQAQRACGRSGGRNGGRSEGNRPIEAGVGAASGSLTPVMDLPGLARPSIISRSIGEGPWR
jgi:hypothetical protein